VCEGPSRRRQSDIPLASRPVPLRSRRAPLPSSRRLTVALAAAVLAAAGLTCSSSTAADPGPGATPSILFVGNSLTYANDLPTMVRGLAQADGRTMTVGMVAKPNLAVVDHTTGSSTAPDEIAHGAWQVVLLQQGPTPAGMCRDTLIIAAMRLDPLIRRSGGRAALWVPWPRRPPVTGLDQATESATLAARAVGGAVVPIGLAWRNALATDPSLPLYGSDGYHPLPAGSLLAALTVYDRIAGRDVRAIGSAAVQAIVPGLGLAQVEILAAAAHEASGSLPPDPTTAVPADTTHVATTGGPC
jgi:hypothetical protein